MNITLFFGSFNPIHTGHLIIGNTVVQKTNSDQLWYVVSPQNPFKKKSNLLPARSRIELIELCIDQDRHLKTSDIELSMPVPSYTIDTLTILKEKYPSYTFNLLMGSDNIMSLHRWKNYELINKNHLIYVYPRPGYESNNKHLSYKNIEILDIPMLEISSTYIRNEIKHNRSIKYLTTDKVLSHIEDMQYYK